MEAENGVVSTKMLPRMADSHQKVLPWSLQRKHGPAHILISELWHPKLSKNKYLLWKSPSLCYFVTAAVAIQYKG